MQNTMAENTPQLIRRAQAHDRDAFAALFEQYKNLAYRTAYLMLDDPHEAEDALQEVFVQVHKSLAGFDPRKGAFTTWLYRITINYCLNHRRKRSFLSLPLDESLSSGEFPGARSAEKDAVWQAVCGLSDKQQAVVVLRYYWDLSYAEVAQVLGIPLGTVKSRLDLALKTLRPALEEDSGSNLEIEATHEL
jgi:RNA polymerase sigma-70 factor (ECF subfamily)